MLALGGEGRRSYEQLDRACDGQGEKRDRESPENELAHRYPVSWE